MGNGLKATMRLRISSKDDWPGDNGAGTRVQRMGEQATKEMLSTFGVHESDIHDLDRTADELANTDTGWRHAGRTRFAQRIRARESEGRAALRAEKRQRTFEPLDETIGRRGRVWRLSIEWLETLVKLSPRPGTRWRISRRGWTGTSGGEMRVRGIVGYHLN